MARRESQPDEALYASLFPRTLNRSEKRKMQILHSAVAVYASVGIQAATYEDIAKHCDVSRTLILHYFPDKEDLLRLVMQFVRADMQESAVQAIQSASDPQAQLEAYIRSTFAWIRKKPDYATVWLLFYYLCGIRPQYKQMHTELAEMGHRRISAMLSEMTPGSRKGSKALGLRAKSIQMQITGALVEAHTEDGRYEFSDLVEATVSACLRLAHDHR